MAAILRPFISNRLLVGFITKPRPESHTIAWGKSPAKRRIRYEHLDESDDLGWVHTRMTGARRPAWGRNREYGTTTLGVVPGFAQQES